MKPKVITIHPKEYIAKNSSNLFIDLHIMRDGWQLHGHEFFEIDFVLSGQAKSNINGKDYDMEKGSVIFLTPTDFHDYRTVGNEPLVTYNIAFTTDMVNSPILSDIPMRCQVSSVDEDTFTGIVKICECMLDEHRTNMEKAKNIMGAGITWILLMILRAVKLSEAKTHRTDTDISAVIAYIYDNFTDTISRDKAAEIMHVSPMHFSKTFHAKMGITFQNYILELRLDYAKRLLSTVDAPVIKIAAASGFNSLNYFSHAFTRRYGISPSRYAKQCDTFHANDNHHNF